MDGLDNDIRKIVKTQLNVPYNITYSIENALYKKDKKTLKSNILKFIITLLLTCISGAGIVFAGVVTYNFICNSNNMAFSITPGYDSERDAKLGLIQSNQDSEIFYRKITKYTEYIEAINNGFKLTEMNSKDFEQYFIVMIALSGEPREPLYISNVNADETSLYIELDETFNEEKYKKQDTLFSVKIEKEYDRENIIIVKNITKPYLETYKDINDITIDYTKEQAINDNCFVIDATGEIADKNIVISSDKNQLKRFVEETQNNKELQIRLVHFSKNGITINDIEYKNEKYIISIVNINHNAKEVFYEVYDSMKIGHFDCETFVSAFNKDTSYMSKLLCIYSE